MYSTTRIDRQEKIRQHIERLLRDTDKAAVFRNGKAKTIDSQEAIQFVEAHLKAEAHIAIIPVCDGGRLSTGFIGLDFDRRDGSFEIEDLRKFAKADRLLRKIGFNVVWVPSRSKGVHAYIHHCKRIPLETAKKLATSLAVSLQVLGVVPEGYKVEAFPKSGYVGMRYLGYGIAAGNDRGRPFVFEGGTTEEDWYFMDKYPLWEGQNIRAIELWIEVLDLVPACVMAAAMAWEEGQRNFLLCGVAGIFRNAQVEPVKGWELWEKVLDIVGDTEKDLRRHAWMHTYKQDRYTSCAILMNKHEDFPIERSVCVKEYSTGRQCGIQKSELLYHADRESFEILDGDDAWKMPMVWDEKGRRWKPAPDPWPYAERILGAERFFSTKTGREGVLWRYNRREGIWQSDAEDWLAKEIIRRDFVPSTRKKKQSFVNDVINLVRMATWTEEFPDSPSTLLPLANGVLDLETMNLHPYVPEYYFKHKLPFRYIANSTVDDFSTLWSFMKDVVKDPMELIHLLALCIYTGSEFETAFILLGRGANGKSVFIEEILKPLVGEKNVSSVALHELADPQIARFRVAELAGKLVNFSGELRYSVVKHSALLKALVSGDTVTAEQKFKNPFKFNSYATLVFATNQLPIFYDETDALYRRIRIIEFPNVYVDDIEAEKARLPETEHYRLKKRDRFLRQKLRAAVREGELDRLGSFIVDYLHKLLTGEIEVPTVVSLSKEKYIKQAYNLAEFLDLFTVSDPDGFIVASELEAVYRAWTEVTGKQKLRSEHYNTVFELYRITRDRKTVFRTKHTIYVGVKWNRPAVWRFFEGTPYMRNVAGITLLPEEHDMWVSGIGANVSPEDEVLAVINIEKRNPPGWLWEAMQYMHKNAKVRLKQRILELARETGKAFIDKMMESDDVVLL